MIPPVPVFDINYMMKSVINLSRDKKYAVKDLILKNQSDKFLLK